MRGMTAESGSARRRQGRERVRERGAVALLAAFVIFVVGGFLALSLNVGHKMTTKAQLQMALDSAALAGAMSLDGTTAGIASAKATAQSFAAQHALDKDPVSITAGDVKVGFWDTVGKRLYFTGQTIPDTVVAVGGAPVTLSEANTPQFYNAVQVKGGADGTTGHNAPVPVFFGAFLGGATQMLVGATSTAVGGGTCSQQRCVMGMVVPICAISDGAGSTMCGQTITLGFNGGAGAPMAFADVTPPGIRAERDEIIDKNDDAENCRDTREQATNVYDPEVIDGLATLDAGSYRDSVGDSVRQMLCLEVVPPFAGCKRRQIPVVNTGCGGPVAGQVQPIGFVNVVVRQVDTAPANTFSMQVYIDCTASEDQTGNVGPEGCANFGMRPRTLRLTQ